MSKTLCKEFSDRLSGHPNLQVDLDCYQTFLDDAEIDDTMKEEFIEALWTVVVSFVDLGYGVHPVQQCQPSETTLDQMSPEKRP